MNPYESPKSPLAPADPTRGSVILIGGGLALAIALLIAPWAYQAAWRPFLRAGSSTLPGLSGFRIGMAASAIFCGIWLSKPIFYQRPFLRMVFPCSMLMAFTANGAGMVERWIFNAPAAAMFFRQTVGCALISLFHQIFAFPVTLAATAVLFLVLSLHRRFLPSSIGEKAV